MINDAIFDSNIFIEAEKIKQSSVNNIPMITIKYYNSKKLNIYNCTIEDIEYIMSRISD